MSGLEYFPDVIQQLIYDFDNRVKYITIFNENRDKINWDVLSLNINAFDELIVNPDKINYLNLALNENDNVQMWFLEHFEDILERYFDYNYNTETYEIFPENMMSCWSNPHCDKLVTLQHLGSHLSQNTNNHAIDILIKYPKFINWSILYKNPNNNAVTKLILPKLKTNNKENPEIRSFSILFENPKEIEKIISSNKTLKIHDNNYVIQNPNDIIVDILLKRPHYPYNYTFLSENSNPKIVKLLEYKLNDNERFRGSTGYIPRNIFIRDFKNINKHADIAFFEFLKNNLDFIDYNLLSSNNSDRAIQLLLRDTDNINWNSICSNTNKKAIEMVFDKFYGFTGYKSLLKCLNNNKSKYAVDLLIKYPELIDWNMIWSNPYIFKSITNMENTPVKKTLRSKYRKYKSRKRSSTRTNRTNRTNRTTRTNRFRKTKKWNSI